MVSEVNYVIGQSLVNTLAWEAFLRFIKNKRSFFVNGYIGGMAPPELSFGQVHIEAHKSNAEMISTMASLSSQPQFEYFPYFRIGKEWNEGKKIRSQDGEGIQLPRWI